MAGFGGETLIYVAGRKGRGKSTFLRATVIDMAANDLARFAVLDTTREWTAHELSKWTKHLAPAQRKNLAKNLRVCPGPSWPLEAFCDYVRASAPCVAVVDEIDLFAPNHAGGLQAGSGLHGFVNYGRHWNVGLLCASRRPARVHADIPALADRVVLFQLSSPRDLAWCEELGGESLARDVRTLV
jgi:hypothetical protein